MEYDCKTLDEKLAISINDSLEIKTDDHQFPNYRNLKQSFRTLLLGANMY
jgi:hypothetical protein